MPGKTDRPLKIGEAAARLGVHEATLRFYEKQGLVTPLRSDGGTRLFAPHHMRRLSAILTLTRTGVALEDIRRIIHARDGCRTGAESSRRVKRWLMARRAEIQRQKAALARLERDVAQALQLVAACRACPNPPNAQGCPDCPVNRQLGDPPLLDLFWA